MLQGRGVVSVVEERCVVGVGGGLWNVGGGLWNVGGGGLGYGMGLRWDRRVGV